MLPQHAPYSHMQDSNQFFEDLVVASSTAAWVSYRVPGKNYASTGKQARFQFVCT